MGQNMNRRFYYFFALLSITFLAGFVAVEKNATGSLKEAFKEHYLIGAAINGFQIEGRDPISKTLIESQFNTITAENEMKWQRIHPKESEYRFDLPDKFVELGEANDMFVVGHTLVWHSQLADWVLKKSETDTALVDSLTLMNRMRDHILTVAGRYKGRVHGWDVLNEALNEDGTLRKSGFLKVAGPVYIEKAFEWAHEADPEAELYYNDYNMANAAKMDGAIRIAKDLQEKGIRIDGIGMQGHWSLTRPTIQEIEESILKVSALGLKVMITELDISVLPNPWDFQGAEVSVRFENRPDVNPYTEGLPDSMQTKLAERYAEIFALFNKHKDKIHRVTFWGVHDGFSWLNNWPVRGRTNYPMLFDRNGEPKPAFEAVMNTLNASAKEPKKKKK